SQLEEINLGGNFLRDLEPLLHLGNLRTLDVPENLLDLDPAAAASAQIPALTSKGVVVLSQPQRPEPPANDDFAKAQVLPGTAGVVEGTTVAATAEPNEPTDGTPWIVLHNSVWYAFTAPDDGILMLDFSDPPVTLETRVYDGA